MHPKITKLKDGNQLNHTAANVRKHNLYELLSEAASFLHLEKPEV